MTNSATIRPDVGIASALASKVRLIDILCVAVSAKIVSAVEPMALSYELDEVRIQWRLSGRDMSAVLPYGMTAYAINGEEHTKVATFSVALKADYRLTTDNGPNVDDLPHYVGIMGYMHTWPYFRADIQHLTAKLGLPPLVLPVVVSGHVPQRVSVGAAPVKEAAAATVLAGSATVRPRKNMSAAKKVGLKKRNRL